MITLYHKGLLQEYPFHIEFVGERAIDAGGVTREMYSAFFEEAYKHLFDGNNLLCPIVHPEMDTSLLGAMGAIVSHAYLIVGILPVRVAFPVLVKCLLGTAATVPQQILTECLIDSLSPHEAEALRKAMDEVKSKVPAFSQDVMLSLFSVLGRFNIRHVPTPAKFKETLIQIASYEFLSKPSAALSIMNAGVPVQHKAFWEGVSTDSFYEIYLAQTASPSAVLQMLEDAVGMNPNEERILMYLRQYVGSMTFDTLRNFLRFVTGSSACSSMKIGVHFNSLSGVSRRPIAHTCAPSLELSCTYKSYPEFVDEFQACMADPYSWIMDAI